VISLGKARHLAMAGVAIPFEQEIEIDALRAIGTVNQRIPCGERQEMAVGHYPRAEDNVQLVAGFF
jgi:hypothetical protein